MAWLRPMRSGDGLYLIKVQRWWMDLLSTYHSLARSVSPCGLISAFYRMKYLLKRKQEGWFLVSWGLSGWHASLHQLHEVSTRPLSECTKTTRLEFPFDCLLDAWFPYCYSYKLQCLNLNTAQLSSCATTDCLLFFFSPLSLPQKSKWQESRV